MEQKAPITLTFDALVQRAVDDELKKRAAKAGATVAGQAMKAADLGDIKVLLSTFGITPQLIEKGITMAFDYLEAQTATKKGGSPGGRPAGGYSPPPPSDRPVPPPASQSVNRVEISPEVMFHRHMLLMQGMIKTYGDIPLSEALKKFDADKTTLIAEAKAVQGASPTPAEVPPA